MVWNEFPKVFFLLFNNLKRISECLPSVLGSAEVFFFSQKMATLAMNPKHASALIKESVVDEE
jgi:hypothetical protein